MENWEGTNPKWGAGTPPFFFYSKNIKTGRSRYAVSTEHTQGASLGGRTAGKGAYSTEFHTELRWSDRAYIVLTKGVSYALN